ncbi:MAG: PhzF family phenazine biosynthesis protein [Cyanobium sp.]
MGPEAGGLRAVLVEAFAERPCHGNGAAVVLLEEAREAPWMQAVARSLAQSETAFLLRDRQRWMLRWFTPTCEVPLCGHATLAALLALEHWKQLSAGECLHLHSRSGPLEVGLMRQRPGWGHVCLPSSGLLAQPCPATLDALLAEQHLGPCQGFWSSSLGYRVGLLAAEAPLAMMPCPGEALQGDLRQGLVLMQSLPTAEAGGGSDGGAITLPEVGGEQADYQLRFFAPGLGIAEDPVTGSAHALVAPWWQARLQRSRVVGWQCSDRPGGMVCEAASSGMIRLYGAGHLLWDGVLRTTSAHYCSTPTDSCGLPRDVVDTLWSDWRTATHCG